MRQLQNYPSLYQVCTAARVSQPSSPASPPPPPSPTPFGQGALDLVLEALPIAVAIVISSTICSEVPSPPTFTSPPAPTNPLPPLLPQECCTLVALGLRDDPHAALLRTPR
jgi:hypothetical protein